MVDFKLYRKGLKDMKKTYNIEYTDGNFVIRYSMPEKKERPIIIDGKKMELDSAEFYNVIFENTNEEIEVRMQNKIAKDVSQEIRKKGVRVCETLQELCDEICKEINQKCFSNREKMDSE